MKFAPGSSSDKAKAKLSEHADYTVEGPGLGAINRATLIRDPKHFLFTLSRYKFVAKILKGKMRVCEIGCHEATGSLIVAKEIGHLTALDFQSEVIEFCMKEYEKFNLNISFHCMDAIDELPGDVPFDAIFMLDVLEHIDPAQECKLLKNITSNLVKNDGVLIVGIPSLESQAYASPVSKAQHINCKSLEGLRSFLAPSFGNVFMFGMNDEVLHTGFGPMCQYLFAICTGPKVA
jgi:2-polyprenyl-3-methyl-5-hydroxy-6-metoxy-1,4-benzoquinol methylase